MTDEPVHPTLHIPASFEAAWGLRERPSRGPKRGLTLERIVAAAIAVADAEGLDAVSMSRVAAELGASAMSLYRYVEAKDELLALMFDTEMGPPAPLPDGWRPALSRWTLAALERYLQAPWSLRIPTPAPPITPNQIRWLESALRCLAGTGLAEQEKLSTVLLLGGVARYHASLAADIADAMAAAGGADLTAGYGQALLRLAPREDFPAVHAAALGGSLDDDDEHFTGNEVQFALDRILDGLELLIARRREA